MTSRGYTAARSTEPRNRSLTAMRAIASGQQQDAEHLALVVGEMQREEAAHRNAAAQYRAGLDLLERPRDAAARAPRRTRPALAGPHAGRSAERAGALAEEALHAVVALEEPPLRAPRRPQRPSPVRSRRGDQLGVAKRPRSQAQKAFAGLVAAARDDRGDDLPGRPGTARPVGGGGGIRRAGRAIPVVAVRRRNGDGCARFLDALATGGPAPVTRWRGRCVSGVVMALLLEVIDCGIRPLLRPPARARARPAPSGAARKGLALRAHGRRGDPRAAIARSGALQWVRSRRNPRWGGVGVTV